MQNISMLIIEQTFCAERARNSFFLLLLSCTTLRGTLPPHIPYCFLGGSMQSYLLYYIIYIFRLFLGLIGIEAQI